MADQAEKLCGSVELGLGPDAPLLVKYDLESSDKVPLRGAQVLLVYICICIIFIYIYQQASTSLSMVASKNLQEPLHFLWA